MPCGCRKFLCEAMIPFLDTPPKQKLWEWAESNIELTPKTGTFAPGMYRTRHTPHVRKAMESYQSPDTRELVLVWASQTSKTLTETICCAWAIDCDPGNTLFVMPSETMAKSFSQNRLQRVILDTESVNRHRLLGREKWQKLEMELDNCVVALAGAGSATNLASRPVRNLFLDEVDKYPVALGEEGNPVVLAEERTKTFPNRRIFKTSTVTTENGEIWQAWLNCEQWEWFCKCPKCGEWYIPSWKSMVFDADGSDNDRAESCRMECPKCHCGVRESSRRSWVTSGEWRKTKDGQSGKVGYRFSELVSGIGRPWPELVKKYLAAVRMSKSGNNEQLRSFVCSVLSEPWRIETDTYHTAGEMRRLFDDYDPKQIPSFLPISGITIGIDTQDAGFYYVVRAWGGGEYMESWLVDYGMVESLDEIARVAFSEYATDSGERLKVSGGFIDAGGHRTHEVYDWCKRFGKNAGIHPSRGERTISGGSKILYSGVDRDRRGKAIPGSVRLARINTSYFKDFLSDKMKVNPDEAGAWHIFPGVDAQYCEQMTSEYRNEDGVWTTKGLQTPNHYWDCEVYALAAAVALRFDRNVVIDNGESAPVETRGVTANYRQGAW